jgi:antirestriction protein ArdC
MPTVYEIVTQNLIERIEREGILPWSKPWVTSAPKNLKSGKEYRGLNIFLLSASGFPRPEYLTYKQAEAMGANVRKGEHGQIITYWNVGRERLNPKTGKVSKPFLLRYYRVFNVTQCERGGVPLVDVLGLSSKEGRPVASIEACDAFLAAIPNRCPIKASDRAWYRPATDEIGIPDKSTFHNAEGFYGTLFHELIHSTGHKSRVGREFVDGPIEFGSRDYSLEELIAETGAAMVCGLTGISPATVDNSAAYLKNWLARLRGDSKLIFTAASAAQRAADYLRGITPKSAGEVAELVEA